MANRCWRFVLALWSCAPAGWFVQTAAAQESPSTTASPPPRLKIDIERHVTEAIARDPSLALPHFKEDVEVRDVYQEALAARLRGIDLECGASEKGPPTRYEMNPYRGATIPVHADFLAPAKLIAKELDKLLGSKKPRYFLYAVHRPVVLADSSTASPAGPTPPPSVAAEYVLRDTPISENARSSVPGTRWELVASFRDRDSALATIDRLRGGFAALRRAREDGRLPPWVSTTCRPPRLK